MADDTITTPRAPNSRQSSPKRILALDGGGVRGIVTIAFLERMEVDLRRKTGNPNVTLGQHFDLIGGTSVGSIIATLLALDWPMAKVASTFKTMNPKIFDSPLRLGIFSPRFKAGPLRRSLNEVLGDMRLDDPALTTGLAIITKRLDTGSPWWIVTNNPNSRFWDDDKPENKNRAFSVADLIRASTAAPTVFNPKRLPMGPKGVYGLFVDGALTPFNSPALALLMTARLKGHGFEWPLGTANLQLVSIGTGTWREPVHMGFWNRLIAARFGVEALHTMISGSQTLSLALLQWMSNPRKPWPINAEIEDLAGQVLGIGPEPHEPLLQFQRYDLELEAEKLALMIDGKAPSARTLKQLRALDDPSEQETLYQLAKKAAETQVDVRDFS